MKTLSVWNYVELFDCRDYVSMIALMKILTFYINKSTMDFGKDQMISILVQ